MWDWLYYLLDCIFHFSGIGTPTGTFLFILSIINVLFVVLYAYRFVFTIIGFFHKKVTYPVSEKKYKIAALIFARNEEKVIETGINSIRKQNYPQELIDIFVVADNCKDKTADIARSRGCKVYERHDLSGQRKGYAMEYFFKKIKEDGTLANYDAFIILDADCIISRDFFSKMNDAYATGKFEAVIGYPDTVNFNDNVITAAYGYNYYRMIMSCHRPKAVLKLGDSGCGTGWLISRTIIEKEGWDSHTLTEDMEYAIKSITKNYKFGFCEEAHVYIEHPRNFYVSCRQRIRCSKGVLSDFCLFWGKLFVSFFKKPSWTKYDGLCEIFPFPLVSFILTLSYQIFTLIYFLINPAGNVNAWINFLIFIGNTLIAICISAWFTAILITIKEWKNIKAPLPKVIFYVIIYPWFDILAIPLSFLSLFMHVKWKKIPHTSTKDNEKLEEEIRALNK